jgi:hypothetical protein
MRKRGIGLRLGIWNLRLLRFGMKFESEEERCGRKWIIE